MAKLTIIVAFDARQGIGIDNKLPWHLPEDLIRFRQITTGHPIIMGRKTYESIGRPLPGRRNIVLTRQTGWQAAGVEAVHDMDTALKQIGDSENFVIGGAEIYAQMLPLCDKLLVTEIHHDMQCDAFFPTIDKNIWRETERVTLHSEKNMFHFSFITFVRSQTGFK